MGTATAPVQTAQAQLNVVWGTEYVSFREIGAVSVTKERESIREARMDRHCTECDQTVKKNQQSVRMAGSRIAHLACAGVEHKIPQCPRCFMIKDDCICDC